MPPGAVLLDPPVQPPIEVRRHRRRFPEIQRCIYRLFRSFDLVLHKVLLPYAMWASRARNASYARNSSDFTADSEQPSTLAICEYSISSYLCMRTAALCLWGRAAIARRTSASFASYTRLCSTDGRESDTCRAGISDESSSNRSCRRSFLLSRSAFSAR